MDIDTRQMFRSFSPNQFILLCPIGFRPPLHVFLHDLARESYLRALCTCYDGHVLNPVVSHFKHALAPCMEGMGTRMETMASNDNDVSFNPLLSRALEEGDQDWHAYRDASREIGATDVRDAQKILALKRACALAYLGKHAKSGAYSKTHVRILTPELVHAMAQANTAQRRQRHPWLARLLDEIDRAQNQTPAKGNVLSLMVRGRTTSIQPPRGA